MHDLLSSNKPIADAKEAALAFKFVAKAIPKLVDFKSATAKGKKEDVRAFFFCWVGRWSAL